MSLRKGKNVLLACCTLFALASAGVVLVATGSFVSPITVFQLNGDPGPNPGAGNCTSPPNWDSLNGTTGITGVDANGSACGSTIRSFITGPSAPTNFTTGGSKDFNDISSAGITSTHVWQFTTTSTPDKDTLTNGYAASYTDATTQHIILVFGAERFAVNGDSNIGIWFFQQAVGLNGSTKGNFTGVHTPGDILAVSAFTQGGGVSSISVYEWNPTACAASSYPSPTAAGQCFATNLLTLFLDTAVGSTGICNLSSPACAVVNSAPVVTSWPYATKFGGSPNTVPQGGFYEGGFDLTAIFPAGTPVPCFSSFLEETRSSQSASAVLKDFLLGAFPQCHISVSKNYACTQQNADNTFNYSYNGTVSNDGGGQVFNVQVTDTPTGGSAVTYNCGTLAKGASATYPSATCPQPTGTTNTVSNLTAHPATNSVSASACTGPLVGGNCVSSVITADFGPVTSTDPPGTTCNLPSDIAVAKRCVTAFQSSGSEIVVRVDFTGEVTNNGSLNLSNVSVSDDAGGGPFGPFTLTPGQSKCYTNGQLVSVGPPATGCPSLTVTDGLTSGTPTGAASYFPSSANAFGLTAGRISFTDTVTATGTASNGTTVGPKTASATCVICPLGACATQ